MKSWPDPSEHPASCPCWTTGYAHAAAGPSGPVTMATEEAC